MPHYLYKSGKYVVDRRSGSLTTFKGVRGIYFVKSDTLKVNDTLFINMIHRY